MTVTFEKPKPRVAVREAGGDNEVERDGLGRPRILVECDRCASTGEVPSEKRPGKMNKCAGCKGAGRKKVSYTRVTTFIDVLEDKETLMTWKARKVLIGAALDTGFLKDITGMDDSQKDDRDTINRRAEAAAELAGASDKADKGTFLHALSELVDNGDQLPEDIAIEDWADIESYSLATTPLLNIVHMERLVVCDEYKCAGTPDRVSNFREGVKVIAPDGYEFTPDDLLITDLKTGRVDYGALKMSMQLSIYSRAKLYDRENGGRISLGNVNQDWGLIMHTPAGTGTTTLYWADLKMGWAAVELAYRVREARRTGKRALIKFAAAEAASAGFALPSNP